MNIKLKYPVPDNEEGRLWALSEFDVDYTEMQDVFKDLVLLAAKITKAEVSLVNLYAVVCKYPWHRNRANGANRICMPIHH
jgi:hypothetical protein